MVVETEVELKAFRTKLRINKENYPKQFDYLMRTAKACVWVRNWYVKETLKRMKENGITIFSPEEELRKYSPREMRKVLTNLINSNEEFAWLKGIPSTPRTYVFEQIEKSFTGGKGKKHVFIKQCKHMANQIEGRISKLKENAKKKKVTLSAEEIEKENVFFTKKGAKLHKPDELFYVKGFPKFIPVTRHLSFPIDNIKVDTKNKYLILPTAIGSKKFNIPKLESVKIPYYDHEFNTEGIDNEAIYTFSYDGESWWVSVKQQVEVVKSAIQEERTEILGIDPGLETTLTFSNGQVIKDIRDNKILKKYEKKRTYLVSKRSKNLDKSPLSTIETPWGKKVKIKSAKYKKLTKHIQHLDNKILRLKDALIKQEVNKINLKNVKGIVIEDFKVDFLKKNKNWSGKVQKVNIGEIIRKFVNRANFAGIQVMKAPKEYPSTQLCSRCGKQNKHMKNNLGERTFVCEYCGHKINRDLNASINLAKLWGDKNLVKYE